MGDQGSGRTAREAGWHVSRYNISAPAPDSDKTIIADYEYKLEQAKAEAEEAKAEAEEAKAEAVMLKQKAIDAARKMKSKGYAIEDIAEITGLTVEQIDAL